MSIFSQTFFNRTIGAAGPEPVGATPVVATVISAPDRTGLDRRKMAEAEQAADARAADVLTFGPQTTPAPPVQVPPKVGKVVDEFVKTYGVKPLYDPGQHFTPTAGFIRGIVSASGVDPFGDGRSIVAQCEAEFVGGYRTLETCGFNAARLIVSAAHQAQQQARASGTEIPSIPDQEELEKANAQKRQIARQRMIAASQKAAPYIEASVKRVVSAARGLVPPMLAEEKKKAEDFGLAFFPSYPLAMLIWFAIEGGHESGRWSPGPTSNPGTALYGVLHHTDPAPAK